MGNTEKYLTDTNSIFHVCARGILKQVKYLEVFSFLKMGFLRCIIERKLLKLTEARPRKLCLTNVRFGIFSLSYICQGSPAGHF